MDVRPFLTDEKRDFVQRLLPIWLRGNRNAPIAGRVACGHLWVVVQGIRIGDVVLAPDGAGSYRFGKVTSDYYHVELSDLQHRRNVEWMTASIAKASLSASVRSAMSSIGTTCNVTHHAKELEALIEARCELDRDI